MLIHHISLQDYINHVESIGINYNGFKMHEVKYYRKHGLGRRNANFSSMQWMPIKIRSTAFKNAGFDIDMVNAGISILQILLKEKWTNTKHTLCLKP